MAIKLAMNEFPSSCLLALSPPVQPRKEWEKKDRKQPETRAMKLKRIEFMRGGAANTSALLFEPVQVTLLRQQFPYGRQISEANGAKVSQIMVVISRVQRARLPLLLKVDGHFW